MDNSLPLPARVVLIVLGISSLLCSTTAMATLPIGFLPVTVFGAFAGILLMAVGLRGLNE